MEGRKEVAREVVVTIDSHPRWLQLARSFVERSCAESEIEPSVARDLVIAAGEAISNVMRHGYGGDETRPIRILCRHDPIAVDVEIWDRGCRFDPSEHPPEAPDHVRRGGRGLYLIQATMDDVAYARKDGWNRLRLTKRLPAPVAGQ